MSYIYLIQSLENSRYKIGVSKNPNLRIKQLQTGNSSPLKLVCKYRSEFAYKIEKVLQGRYSYLKKEGEWFDLTLENELSFIDECKKIGENVKYLVDNGNVFI